MTRRSKFLYFVIHSIYNIYPLNIKYYVQSRVAIYNLSYDNIILNYNINAMFKFNKIIEMVLKFFFPKDEFDKKAENISIDILSKKLSLNNKTEDEFIYTLFDYRDEVIKNMIWSLKYKKNKKVAKLFAQILYDFLQEELSDLNVYSDFNKPLLIPLPMHKKHLQERRFNQTEILAKELCDIAGESLCILKTDLLKKIKNTSSQTTLVRSKRLKNIKGVFYVNKPDEIKNRDIILLDDVITTGATLKEARKVLLAAGAKNIISVAIAH